ncbi:hypothetical protein [Dactylosporangium cerinum]
MAGRVRARVFGEVADDYERFRPDYPPALIDDVLAYAGLDGAAALEVGAGTGKATVAFAERVSPSRRWSRTRRWPGCWPDGWPATRM